MLAGLSTKQHQDVFTNSVLLRDIFVGIIIAEGCIHIEMYLINTLPGNSSVNTVQHTTIYEAVF
jgi:hypothetical protein